MAQKSLTAASAFISASLIAISPVLAATSDTAPDTTPKPSEEKSETWEPKPGTYSCLNGTRWEIVQEDGKIIIINVFGGMSVTENPEKAECIHPDMPPYIPDTQPK